MTAALFLRPDDTLLLSYVESNYDNDQLRALIYDVQQLKVLPLLGTALYNELDTQVTANTVTSDNTSLLNKLSPCIRMYVLSMGEEVFNYKFRNKGIMKMNSDNSQSVDLDVLDRLVRKYSDQAQEYAQRVTNFLVANSSTYPLFSSPGTASDTIVPMTNSYQIGLYLGKGSCCSPLDDYIDLNG